MLKFRIRLRPTHLKSGSTYYRAAKGSGVAPNTVQKYVQVDEIISDTIPTTVVALANYYGVDWRSPEIIEVIEVPDEA